MPQVDWENEKADERICVYYTTGLWYIIMNCNKYKIFTLSSFMYLHYFLECSQYYHFEITEYFFIFILFSRVNILVLEYTEIEKKYPWYPM